MPIEWIYAALNIKEVRRRQLRAMLEKSVGTEWADRGRENAASVAPGDGFRMIEALCPAHVGPAPLWTQPELRNDRRSNVEIDRVLGVHREKVRRWRANTVFDPLTEAPDKAQPRREYHQLLGLSATC